MLALAAATLIAAAELPRQVAVEGHMLALASCGVRDLLWMDYYAAGLYVRSGASPAAAADPREPKAVVLRVLESRWLPTRIPRKWRKALQWALDGRSMAMLDEAYGALRDGDVVAFTYGPHDGVAMRVNGASVARASGHAVIDAVLGTWAGGGEPAAKLRRLASEHPC